jgi:hypothetical protein
VGERADPLTERDQFRDADRAPRSGSFAGPTDTSNPTIIAEEIEQTRAEMSETIDAIQERLDPNQLTDQAVGAATEVTEQARDAAKEVITYAIDEAKTAVRELAGQATESVRESTVGRIEHMALRTRDTSQSVGTDLMSLIKANPVPAALAGIGIGWLWMQRSGNSESNYDHMRSSPYAQYGYGNQRGSQGESSGQVMGQAQEMAGQAAGQAQHIAGQVAHQAQDTAGQVQAQAVSAARGIANEPIAMAALGLALGAAAAFILPETEEENQILGDTKARMIDRVQEAAGETAQKVQRVASQVGETAMQEAEAQGLTQASNTAGVSSQS